jgi:hypothetical protein
MEVVMHILLCCLLLSWISFTDCKLNIRKKEACTQKGSCPDRRGIYVPTSQADAEYEVNRLRQSAIKDYDNGVYVAAMDGWGPKENRALDIQTKLGYTVPENFEWGD